MQLSDCRVQHTCNLIVGYFEELTEGVFVFALTDLLVIRVAVKRRPLHIKEDEASLLSRHTPRLICVVISDSNSVSSARTQRKRCDIKKCVFYKNVSFKYHTCVSSDNGYI